ncbi:hypothetical protein [Methylomonas koyamae]|uniref:Uncharacterized protein n=1 Tax=Methylomonas koyamae TaxID=702114 RepID=A0A291IDS3_9GAMM|nr:hypothetical protein [Methylomonas koyamae]ATG88339.1 hypothetical protein MKLM6_0050 [Methylomonas koyamae]OAI29977.1 hypothetical protein A1356_22705 [Methylomonas koyamae]
MADENFTENRKGSNRMDFAEGAIAMSEPIEYKLINAIEELTKMLSERLWSNDAIPDRFVLAGLADGARASVLELRDTLEMNGLRSEKSDDPADSEE